MSGKNSCEIILGILVGGHLLHLNKVCATVAGQVILTLKKEQMTTSTVIIPQLLERTQYHV